MSVIAVRMANDAKPVMGSVTLSNIDQEFFTSIKGCKEQGKPKLPSSKLPSGNLT